MQKLAIAAALLTSALVACVIPKMPFLSSNSSSHEQKTVSTSETHTVNGHPVDKDGNREDDDDAPRAKPKRSAGGGAEFGATCRHNDDCASNTCYVGAGELGYCTKICDDFGDCPMSWECTHEGVGNAPQKICQQEKD